MRQGARGWCTGMAQRDGTGREVGGSAPPPTPFPPLDPHPPRPATPGLPRWTPAPGCRLRRRLSSARPPGYIPRGWGAEVSPATHLRLWRWPGLSPVATAQSGASGAFRGLRGGAARLPVAAGPGPVFPAGRRLSFALLSARSPGPSPRPPSLRPASRFSRALPLSCSCPTAPRFPSERPSALGVRGKGAWDVGAGTGHGCGVRGGCRLGARGGSAPFRGKWGGGRGGWRRQL